MILEWLKNQLIYILLGIIAVLLITTVTVAVQLKIASGATATALAEKATIAEQLKNSQLVVRQLATATEEYSVRLKDTVAAAEKAKKKWDAENVILRNEPVPKACEESAIWAKEKTKQLLGKW